MFVQAEASAKAMDDTIMRGVIIDLTNIGVMDKTGEASSTTMANESTTSNEVTSRDKGKHDVVIVYSTSSSPTPLNYAQPTNVACDKVQDMIVQAMKMKFFVERQLQENEQFRLSMQNAITTQFSNLSVVLLQNIQWAQMFMLEVVVAL
ncbi:hypothetical protein HKD37_13G035616 [Glycine soja]